MADSASAPAPAPAGGRSPPPGINPAYQRLDRASRLMPPQNSDWSAANALELSVFPKVPRPVLALVFRAAICAPTTRTHPAPPLDAPLSPLIV